MSESLLKAILRLFALVAGEDQVTHQEREQIKSFLEDHLGGSAVDAYLKTFDQLIHDAVAHSSNEDEKLRIQHLCDEVSRNLTQKQKAVIILELIAIVQADGVISPKEQELIMQIGEHFKIESAQIKVMEKFVLGKSEEEIEDDKILLISAGSSAGRKTPFMHRHSLKGFMAVLFADTVDLFFVKYLGSSGVYLNGVPVKSGKIQVLAVGSLLRTERDEPIYYGDILNKFKRYGEFPRLSFEARKISYTFKNGRLGLREVSLAEESGHLVALMGASGAGKSTLLHVLNGSEKPSSGSVLINDIDIHKHPEKMEGVIGFVPQDDLLIEDLTVYQNLYYAAKLCFSDKNEQEIHTLVTKVLEDLGLAEIGHLKVGSPLQKTISGGQRKRLNIGLELLREPSVLFCDEPTSGLSSRDSENIIDLLKELSLKGKLVFAVIHQPSSDIFKMFDRLLILDTGGYQIYYGNPVNAIAYFKKSIDLVNSEEGECHECGNVNPEQIFNIIETKVINEYGNFTNERKIPAEKWNEVYRKEHRPPAITTATNVPLSTLRIPSRFKQARLFSLRDIQAKLHNTQYLVINLLEAPVLAFILAFIVRYYNVDDKFLSGYVFGKNLNLPAYLFMSVIVALFMGLTVSAEEIIRDRKILKREAFLHLSRSSYLVSKISILLMLSAVQTFLFVLVGNYILQIEGTFLEHWFILFTTSCFANLLGLNISSAFNSAVTIYILIPLLLIPQLILSGVVVKFDKLNPSIGNTATVPLVGDLMASRWAFEAAMVTQFKENDFSREFYWYDKIMAQADFKKVYWIPELETRLQFVVNNSDSDDAEVQAKIKSHLALVKNELTRELAYVQQPSDVVKGLNPETFSPQVYEELTRVIDKLKRHYIDIYNKADRKKEQRVAEMMSGDARDFTAFKEKHHNDAISDLVKNMSETHRIIEKDRKLIQKIYPIYKDPDPDHPIDFDAQFYMPAKHFLGNDVDTFWFNTGVVWAMTSMLALFLYLDVLRRIVDAFGSLSNPLNRRK